MKITAFYCTMLWADVPLTRSATLLELRFAIKALNICKKWKLIDYFSVEFHTMGQNRRIDLILDHESLSFCFNLRY